MAGTGHGHCKWMLLMQDSFYTLTKSHTDTAIITAATMR